MSLIFSVLNVRFRDTQFIVEVGLILGCSGDCQIGVIFARLIVGGSA